MIASALPGVMPGGPRVVLGRLAIAFAVVLVLLFILLVALVREHPEYVQREANPLVPGVRRAMRNRPFAILLVTLIVGSLPAAIPALMVPFFTDYVVQPEDTAETLSLFLSLYFGSGFLCLPAWIQLGKRLGKLRAWLLSYLIGISGGISLFFAGAGDVLYVALLHVYTGTAFGAGFLLVPSMQADVIDYDELHTGKRREAQYSSFWAIVPKFVAIPGAALPIAALGAIGYVPNQPQTPQVILGIRVIYALTPAFFGALAFLIARLYPITEQVHAQIREGIARHARGESAVDPLTREVLAPPSTRDVDEETGWFLDYFSRRELERVLDSGASGLVRAVASKALGCAVLLLIFACTGALSIRGLDVQPGPAAVLSVVAGGFSLTAVLFHLLRLPAAFRMKSAPTESDLIEAHLRRPQPRAAA